MQPYILKKPLPDAIETARLRIRSPQPGDGPEFNAAILETLQGLQTWLGIYRDQSPTVAETETIVQDRYAQFVARQNFMLLCFRKDTNTLVATTSLFPNWKVPSFEVGYWCRQSYQGQGLVTEAVVAITEFAFDFLDAKRVFILCDIDNQPSINVARRAGFELEGTLRNDDRKADGTLASTFVFSQIRPD